jgi:hypothetical protein
VIASRSVEASILMVRKKVAARRASTASSEATPSTTATAPIGVRLPTASRQITAAASRIGGTIERPLRFLVGSTAAWGSQAAPASRRKARGQPMLARLSASVDCPATER